MKQMNYHRVADILSVNLDWSQILLGRVSPGSRFSDLPFGILRLGKQTEGQTLWSKSNDESG